MGSINEDNKTEFGFQWHITNRCNLRCSHCYQEDYSGSNELGLDGLISELLDLHESEAIKDHGIRSPKQTRNEDEQIQRSP